MVALSKTENGAALFTRMQVVEDVTSKTLQQVVDETVAPGSKIECDGYKSYRNLSGGLSQILCKHRNAVQIEQNIFKAEVAQAAAALFSK